MPKKTKHEAGSLSVLTLVVVVGFMALSTPASAGEYTDKLSECLVVSTTENDKLSLVKWMFTSMALHPAVEEIANVSMSSREKANREMADMIIELLSRRCYSETRLALKQEGSVALQTSFSILGQVAATSLFSNPNVAAGLASLETYISASDLENRLDIGQ